MLWEVPSPEIRRSDGSVEQGRMITPTRDWVMRVERGDLTWIEVDHSVRLRFDQTVVTIESPFVFRRDEVDHHLDPGERAGLGPLVAVYPDALARSGVEENGTLVLGFTSGVTIAVPADEHYEAWQISGPDGYLVVCAPGGNLAVWG